MTIYIFKNLMLHSLKNSSHLYKLHISSSFSHLFSSSRQKKPKGTTAVGDYLLYKHQFSPETASKVSSVLRCLKDPEKSDSVLTFLKESGFTQTHLEQVITRLPNILSSKVDHSIKPKIKLFQDFGFSPTDIADIISADPWILMRSADNQLGPSILVLRNVLGSNADLARVLKISGWFLKRDLEKTMLPNIEFMKSCGIGSSQIRKYVFNFPRFFLLKPESLKELVKRVDEMGFDRKSKMFIHAIRTVGSMSVENWELKLQLFRSLGFSEDEIRSVFRRAPHVFAVSERKVKEVVQVMLSTGKLDISFIVNHPTFLISSVEKRLKPRLQILEVLERKKLLLKRPSWTTVYRISDDKFFERFVLPYSDKFSELQMSRNICILLRVPKIPSKVLT